MTPRQPINFIANATPVLVGIESALNRCGYPDNPSLRSLIRSHCIRRAVEEILLIDRIVAESYLDFAYQLVKNNYVRYEHGHPNALLEDVNRFCLHYSISTSSLEGNPTISVRGKWFTTNVF